MVKFYESYYTYDYPFATVSLAYFLRYPNPYATHVLSTDVIDRQFDTTTRRLSTIRLHHKKSKIPAAVLKVLPKGLLGGSDAGESYVLEKSIIDVREGWMKTEARNLEWTGILSVSERQHYQRQESTLDDSDLQQSSARQDRGTEVKTVVTLVSRLGQGKTLLRRYPTSRAESANEESDQPRQGLLSRWGAGSLQRTIEMVGLRRTREATGKSALGMQVVLERYRLGGLCQVLEGMQQDRERAFGETGPWKRSGPGLRNDHEP